MIFFFCRSFPVWRLLLSGSYLKKNKIKNKQKNHPGFCTLNTQHRSAHVCGTYSSTKPNDRISGPAGNTRTTLLLDSELFRQDRIFRPFTMKWMDFNLWIFPNLQKKRSWWCIRHSSFPYTYCMLLWQSKCKCNFPRYLSECWMSNNYPLCHNQTDTNSDATPVENIRQGSFGYSSPSVKQHAYSLI